MTLTAYSKLNCNCKNVQKYSSISASEAKSSCGRLVWDSSCAFFCIIIILKNSDAYSYTCKNFQTSLRGQEQLATTGLREQLWCILLQWSVRCKRSWPLTLQHWRAVLFSEVQPECKEVQCTVYFGKCTLAKCLLLQELLSAKVHSAQCLLLCLSVQCTVHTCTAHSAQCTVQSTKCTVCSSSTAMQAQQLSSLWRAELHCILSPLYPLLHTFHCRGGGNFVCWAIKSWEET